MLKLFENRVVNTMNKLAVSIEDIKGGRFEGEDKGRDGSGGGGGGGAGMTHDVMSVLTEQHNRLMLALAAQTQKLEAHTQQLDKLEHVCLHRTRSDEPMVEDLHQTMRDLKERLGELSVRAAQQFPAIERARAREQRPFRRHTPADDIASPLFVPYSPQDKGQRGKESRGGTARERLHSHGTELKTERSEALKTLYLKYIYKRPFSAATDGKCQGTPTVLNLQAELVQVSQFPTFKTDGSGGGRDARLSRYQPGAAIEIDLPE